MSLVKALQTDGILNPGGFHFHYCPVYGQKVSTGGTKEWYYWLLGGLRGEERRDQNYFSRRLERERWSLLSWSPDDFSLKITDYTWASSDRLQAEQTWTAETNWFLLGTGLAPGYQLMKFSEQFYFLSVMLEMLETETFTSEMTARSQLLWGPRCDISKFSKGLLGAGLAKFALSLSLSLSLSWMILSAIFSAMFYVVLGSIKVCWQDIWKSFTWAGGGGGGVSHCSL